MSEGMFLNIIHRYFIKSIVLKRSFEMKNFERFYKINKKQVPGINKSAADCTSTRDKGFFKVIWAFFIKILGIKKKELSELEKFLKEETKNKLKGNHNGI